ncbi:nuclear pore complex protein Nup133-like [Apostichopus japonicus]|uniref:nuclear pore complex protein Nup133-like n=1 Tax=Stichopus japonicus TaxID=307972 RepID=UPI003AB774F7
MQSFQVLQDTPQYTVSSYGTSLPVLITETLLQADRSAVISVQLDETGWGCFVCGRKLFVWRFKHSQLTRANQCYRLALPASELCHAAKLVCLFPSQGDTQAPSVLAVSPEGVIRFWTNLHNELAFYERGLDLSGQECFSVTHLGGNTCVLATTSNQMILLSVSSQHMQTQVEVHNLKPSQGMLSRMSSLIFGYSKSHTAQIRRVCAGSDTSEGREVYVLHDDVLQKWLISEPGLETVIYEKQLGTVLVHHFQREMGLTTADGLKTWLLDVQPTSSSVLLLAAVTNINLSTPKLHYAIVEMKSESSMVEGQDPVDSIHVTDQSLPYKVSDEVSLLDCHLLLPTPGTSTSFVYGKNLLLGCSLSPDIGPVFQDINITNSRTSNWGAGAVDNECLFFNSSEGLVAVKMNLPEMPSMDESIVSQSRPDQSLLEVSRFEMSQSFLQTSLTVATPRKTDGISKDPGNDHLTGLKAAFLCACRSNLTQAENMLEELFPLDGGEDGYTDSPLDQAVKRLSLELINDFPPADPRWAESVPQDSITATGSLILIHQLEDKMKAHERLVSFLKSSGLWERLHSVSGEEAAQSSHSMLGEHVEKLAAARALCHQHSEYPNLIDAAISRVTDREKLDKLPSGLTLRDVFYTEVSSIQMIFQGLQEEQDDLLSTDFSPRDSVTLISNVNNIYQAVLQEAWQVHESKALVYQSSDSSDLKLPAQLWTASSGPKGLRNLISQQHNLTIQHGVKNAEDGVTSSNLCQQLFSLTELQLDGYCAQLESIRDCIGEEALEYGDLEQKYMQERSALVTPFVKFGQTERAASLAEKFLDFGTLVELCEDTATGQKRIQHYMDFYVNQGFPDFVFKYYIDRGQRGKLMTHFSHRPELSNFLRQHDHISWLQDIQTNNYTQAHMTLKKLADRESLSVAKKKTLLSLSKLSALAADEVDESAVKMINEDLHIISHQEHLPSSVIQRLQMDVDDMPVIDVYELIELYTGEKNVEANEYDFMKALDLLMMYIPNEDPKVPTIRQRIWSRAILRNSWTEIPGADPFQFCRQTVFFKTALMAMQAYSDSPKEEFLPSPDELLDSEELSPVKESKNFQYLLRLGMEKLNQS